MAAELRGHGYVAYDLEHNGLSAWFNKESGAKAAEFGQVPERTHAWLSAHEWRIDISKIIQLIQDGDGGSIFLCGGGANQDELMALCDKTIWLQTDEATIRARVHNKRDHSYGTKPHELAKAIQDNINGESHFRNAGAVIVGARQPKEIVLKEILSVST